MPSPNRSLISLLAIVISIVSVTVFVLILVFNTISDFNPFARILITILTSTLAVYAIYAVLSKLYKPRSSTAHIAQNKSMFFQKLFAESPDAIFVLEASTLIVHFCNKAASYLLGKSTDSIVGKTVVNVFPEEQADKASFLFCHLSKEFSEKSVTISFVDADGKSKLVEFCSRYVVDYDKSWIIAIGRDETSRERSAKNIADELHFAHKLAGISSLIDTHEDYESLTHTLMHVLSDLDYVTRLTLTLLPNVEFLDRQLTYPIKGGRLPSARRIEDSSLSYWAELCDKNEVKHISPPYEAEMSKYLELSNERNNTPACLLVLPVQISNKPYGLIIIESSSLNIFSENTVDFFSKLRDFTVLVLKNIVQSATEKNLVDNLYRVANFFETSQCIKNTETLFNSTGELLLKLFNFDCISFYLYDDVLKELCLSSSLGSHADSIDVGARLNIENCLPIEAARTGKCIQTSDVNKIAKHIKHFSEPDSAGFELSVPIRSGNTTIGVIDFISCKARSICDVSISLIGLIASQLASALLSLDRSNDFQVLSETHEAYKENLAGDIAIAEKLLDHLLPFDFVHPNIEIGLKHISKNKMEGNYAKVACFEDWIYLIIGKVCGQSITAALVISGVNTEIEHLISRGKQSIDIALAVNEYVTTNFGFMGLCMTLFCARLNTKSGLLEYFNAGHKPAILQRQNGKILSLESSNFPLGLLKNELSHHIFEDQIHIVHGSRILLYSDGLICDNEGCDNQKLIDLVKQTSRKSISEVPDDLIANCTDNDSSSNAESDKLVIAVEYRDHVIVDESFSSFSHIDVITKKLVKLCGMLDYTRDDTMMLHLAIYEMMVNSVKHGHKFDESKTATIKGRILRDSWEMCIEDQGPGFEFENVYNASLDFIDIFQTSGRGILLTKQIVDSMWFENDGSKVVLQGSISRTDEKSSPKKEGS